METQGNIRAIFPLPQFKLMHGHGGSNGKHSEGRQLPSTNPLSKTMLYSNDY